MTEVHALAGCLETGLCSGLGDTCGRLTSVCSERFRDWVSGRVSEASAAEVGTGLTEYSVVGTLSPLSLFNAEIEIPTGSEWCQLRQHA